MLTASSRIALLTSDPFTEYHTTSSSDTTSKRDLEPSRELRKRVGIVERRRLRASAAHATTRYSAPLSSRCHCRRRASRTASVPLPEPLGPSTAITGDFSHDRAASDRSFAAAPPVHPPATASSSSKRPTAQQLDEARHRRGPAVVLRQHRGAILATGSGATSTRSDAAMRVKSCSPGPAKSAGAAACGRSTQSMNAYATRCGRWLVNATISS